MSEGYRGIDFTTKSVADLKFIIRSLSAPPFETEHLHGAELARQELRRRQTTPLLETGEGEVLLNLAGSNTIEEIYTREIEIDRLSPERQRWGTR